MLKKHLKLTDKDQEFIEMSSEEFYNYIKGEYPEHLAIEPNHSINLFKFEVLNGWHHIIAEMFSQVNAISKNSEYEVRFAQIKEKFGSPRFYYNLFLKEGKKENNEVKNAIKNLINYHEDYCNTIDDLTGKNIDSPKLVVLGWYYGHTLESHIDLILKSNKTDEEKKEIIEKVSKGMERKYLLKELEKKIYYLKMQDLEIIKEKIEEFI